MFSRSFKRVGLHYTAFRDAIREDSRQTTPSRGVTPRKKFVVEANVESRANVYGTAKPLHYPCVSLKAEIPVLIPLSGNAQKCYNTRRFEAMVWTKTERQDIIRELIGVVKLLRVSRLPSPPSNESICNCNVIAAWNLGTFDRSMRSREAQCAFLSSCYLSGILRPQAECEERFLFVIMLRK